MGRHVKRASRQKIAWFRKKLGPLVEERMGYREIPQTRDLLRLRWTGPLGPGLGGQDVLRADNPQGGQAVAVDSG